MRIADEIIYIYDGSFEGFLSCIFEVYASKKPPSGFIASQQGSLFENTVVQTDPEKAQRVYLALAKKISPAVQQTVSLAFMSCKPQKEMDLYRFISLGFKYGGQIMSQWSREEVVAVRRAARQVVHEAERLCGFVRLCDSNGVLTGTIEPDNQVLPIIAEHFMRRYREQPFLLYDKRHRQALVYQPYTYTIVPMEDFVPRTPDERETAIEHMWKRYFNTLSIEQRQNLSLQSRLMPKKYRKYITELHPEMKVANGQKAVASKHIL